MDVYADLLRGLRGASAFWDPYVALWYLADCGNPRYVPLFLELAAQDSVRRNGRVQALVAYGLVRNDTVPAAAERLRAHARLGPGPQSAVVDALITANDTIARTLLREIPLEQMQPHQQEWVEAMLATPPIAPGEGRWPCFEGQGFRKAPDGRFRCCPPGQPRPY
jgi:hypothetical protein